MAEYNSFDRLHSPPEFISVISSNHCARIRINDIEMIEQDGRRIHIVTAEKDYSFYGSLNSIAVSLADRAFFRVLKGLNFNSGQSLTLGRNSISKTRAAFKRYLMKYPPYTFWDPAHMAAIAVHEIGESELESQNEVTN